MFKKLLTCLLAVSMLMAAIPFAVSADVPADARVLDGARFVTLGGSIFGIAGMMVSVPAATAVYNELRADMTKREQERIAAQCDDVSEPES